MIVLHIIDLLFTLIVEREICVYVRIKIRKERGRESNGIRDNVKSLAHISICQMLTLLYPSIHLTNTHDNKYNNNMNENTRIVSFYFLSWLCVCVWHTVRVFYTVGCPLLLFFCNPCVTFSFLSINITSCNEYSFTLSHSFSPKDSPRVQWLSHSYTVYWTIR